MVSSKSSSLDSPKSSSDFESSTILWMKGFKHGISGQAKLETSFDYDEGFLLGIRVHQAIRSQPGSTTTFPQSSSLDSPNSSSHFESSSILSWVKGFREGINGHASLESSLDYTEGYLIGIRVNQLIRSQPDSPTTSPHGFGDQDPPPCTLPTKRRSDSIGQNGNDSKVGAKTRKIMASDSEESSTPPGSGNVKKSGSEACSKKCLKKGKPGTKLQKSRPKQT